MTRDTIKKLLNEKLMLKNWGDYTKLVAKAYEEAQDFDSTAVPHWKALNESNYTLFKKLLSKINVVFVTEDKSKVGTLNILGRAYKVEFFQGDPYPTQADMKADLTKTGVLKISMDYSDHPVFSVIDNIVFRTVHDYIVHILGNKPFGAQGEIASYNLHAKLVPNNAIPAIFTEVVGQACFKVTHGDFPKQKIAILKGFDYINIGKVEDYDIKDKNLVPKV